MRRRSAQPEWEGQWPPLPELHHADVSHAAGGLWCHAKTDALESDRGSHMHNTLELGWMLRGAKRYRIGDARAMIVRPGDMWFCTMWEPHSWEVLRPHTDFVSINLSPEVLIETVGALSWFRVFAVPASQRPRITDPGLRRLVRTVGGELHQEIAQHQRGWQARLQLGLGYLLALYLRDWPADAYPESLPPDRVSRLGRVMPAVSLAAVKPGVRIDRREAARACSVSPSRFHGLFREAMGLTFEQFCRQARLAYARHLLLTSQLTVAAIAGQTGFAGESHFHRAFAEHHGCTPAVYRRYLGAPPELTHPRPLYVDHTTEDMDESRASG